MSRRSLALLVALSCLLVGACGDDDDTAADESVDPNATATVVEDDEEGADDDAPAGDDYGGRDASTTTVPDAAAEEPPADAGGEEEGLGDQQVYVADLSGDTEVPGPGDAGATGRAELEAGDDGEVCIDMVAEGLDSGVTAAHVHEGAAGASGGPVVTIGTPSSTEGATARWTDVCVPVDAEVRDRMAADPSAFYVNVHTSTFPDGAVRGQLQAATIFDLTLS